MPCLCRCHGCRCKVGSRVDLRLLNLRSNSAVSRSGKTQLFLVLDDQHASCLSNQIIAKEVGCSLLWLWPDLLWRKKVDREEVQEKMFTSLVRLRGHHYPFIRNTIMVGSGGAEEALSTLTTWMAADRIFRSARLNMRYEKGDIKRCRLEYESCKRILDHGMRKKIALVKKRHDPLSDMPL